MTYEDVKNAKKNVDLANQLLIDSEISYLQGRGCTMNLDHDNEIIGWILPYVQDGWNLGKPCDRATAMELTTTNESILKREAKKQIEKLKTQHNIED